MTTGYTLCQTFDRALGRRPRRYYPLHRIQGLQKAIEVWGRTMAFEVTRKDVLGSFMDHD